MRTPDGVGQRPIGSAQCSGDNAGPFVRSKPLDRFQPRAVTRRPRGAQQPARRPCEEAFMVDHDEHATASSFAEILVHESPDALIALTLEGVIRAWNRGAREMFGYTADEAVGLPLDDLIVPDDKRDESRAALARVVSEGFAIIETVRRRRDGSRFQ